MLEERSVEEWRRETPAAAGGRIHLNNAGAALVPTPVQEAVLSHLELEARIGGYEAADVSAGAVESVYDAVASLVGGAVRNVAVVENATVAFSQALSALDPGAGDRIITTRNDYASNQLMYLSLAERRGVEVVRAAELPEGGVDPESVRSLIRARRPALVAVSWVPTNSGLVQAAAAVGEVCAEAEVPYLVDACQAVGQIPVDVASLRCDFLAATARKFLRGPRGVGFLCVSDRALEAGLRPLHLDMRGADWIDADRYALRPDARRFENWEFPYALVMGLGAACRYAMEVGVEVGGGRARLLAASLRNALAGVAGVRVLDRGRELCAIVTIAVTGRNAPELVASLRESGINTSAVDRVSAVIDMDDKGVEGALRLSPHYYNTEAEVRAAVVAVAGLVVDQPGRGS